MSPASQLIGALVSYAAMGGVGCLAAAMTHALRNRIHKQATGENQP